MIENNLTNDGKGVNSSMKDESFPNKNLSKVARFPGLNTLRKGRNMIRTSRNLGKVKGPVGKQVKQDVAAARATLYSKNKALAGMDTGELGVRGRFMQKRRMGQLQKTIKGLEPAPVKKVKKVMPAVTTPAVPDLTGKSKKTKKYFTKKQFGKFTVGGGALLGGGYLLGTGSGKSQQRYNKYY